MGDFQNQIKKCSIWLFQIFGALYLPFNIANPIFNAMIEYCWSVLNVTINISLFYLYYISYNKLFVNAESKVLNIQDFITSIISLLHETLKTLIYLHHNHNTKKLLESIQDISLNLNSNTKNFNCFAYTIIGYCIIVILMICECYFMNWYHGWFGLLYVIPYELNSLLLQVEIHVICEIFTNIKQNFIEINRELRYIYNLDFKIRNSIKLKRIVNIMQFYNKIHKTAKVAIEIFQFSIMTIAVTCISFISTYTYTLVVDLMQNIEKQRIELYYVDTFSTIRIVICFINILFIIKSVMSITDEVRSLSPNNTR